MLYSRYAKQFTKNFIGMPFINDFQLTPIWQPNVFLPSLCGNIYDITSTIWTSQTADNKNTITDNIYMNMLITTDDLSKSDQVPPDRFDIVCKHVTDDLHDTVSSKLPRPPPPTSAGEPPLRPLLPEPKTRPPKRPLDDEILSRDEQLSIESAITKCDISDDFYEVEDIISSKRIKLNGRFCKVILIKWKNDPDDASTWEFLYNLNTATKKLVKTRNF